MILSNPVGWVRDGDTDNNIKDRMNEGIEDILSRWLATVVCTSGYGARYHSYRALAGSKSECSAAPDTYEHIASPAFGQGDMLRLGVTDMADALHRMPGINLRDYGGAGGMKTVAVRGFGAGHTGVSYDGVLLSECQGGEIDMSRYSLDQVQTLRLTIGDNDDIFISARQASVAALLAIETMSEIPIDKQPHLSTQLQVGSFGYVSPYLRYVQRLSDRFTLQAMGEYTYAENDYPFLLRNGKYTTHERRTNSRMNSGHGELNMHWMMGRRADGTSRNQLWAKLYYYDNDRQLPGIVRYYTNVAAEQLHDRNAFAQARWQARSLDDHWMLKVQAKMNWASSAYQDTLVANRRNDATYWQREYYTSAALMWMPDDGWALDYSADWMMNSLNSTLATDLRPHRHGILQSLSVRYAKGRWVALARMLASVYLNSVGRKIETQQGSANPTKAGQAAKDARRLSPSLSLSYRLLGMVLPAMNFILGLRTRTSSGFLLSTRTISSIMEVQI